MTFYACVSFKVRGKNSVGDNGISSQECLSDTTQNLSSLCRENRTQVALVIFALFIAVRQNIKNVSCKNHYFIFKKSHYNEKTKHKQGSERSD